MGDGCCGESGECGGRGLVHGGRERPPESLELMRMPKTPEEEKSKHSAFIATYTHMYLTALE